MARAIETGTLNAPLGDPLMKRVSHELVRWSVATFVTALVACSGHGSESVDDPQAGGPADPGHLVPAAAAPSPSDPGLAPGAAGTGANTGLPCDVQAILEDRCITCHSGTYPPPLLTYDNLVAPAPSDPKKSLAAEALERMKSVTAPMPPPPAAAPDATEIATFEAWVTAGAPRGAACTTLPDGGAPPPAASPYATPTVCWSGKTSTAGEGSSMKPGMACNACHQKEGGPNLRIGGTVYKTAHEPDNCVGAAPPPQLTVIITDAKGRKISLPVNSAGNFSTRSKLSAPYRAVITDGTKTRAMAGSVTTGDCNSCHTEQGANGAPGRVMAP